MFAQLYGSKRVLLIAPRFSRFLYAFPDAPTKSQIDPENPDLQRFPRFADCEQLRWTLKPGDLLYIPRGWWHFLATDEVSISANCWHGRSLKRFERARQFLAAGPKVFSCWARDFFWHGLLRHPCNHRLFSSAPLGLQSYQNMRHFVGRLRKLFY